MSGTRCEPVDTTRDGWHWVQCRNHDRVLWWGGGEWTIIGITGKARGVFPQQAADLGYRYLAPAIPPAVVAALVAALEGIAAGVETFAINPEGGGDIIVEGGARFAHERDVKALLDTARSALAAYRGQA